jgi:hypothetical protein
MCKCGLHIQSRGSVAATDTRTAGKGTQVLVISYYTHTSEGLNLLLKCIQSKNNTVYLKYSFIAASFKGNIVESFASTCGANSARVEGQYSKWCKHLELIIEKCENVCLFLERSIV